MALKFYSFLYVLHHHQRTLLLLPPSAIVIIFSRCRQVYLLFCCLVSASLLRTLPNHHHFLTAISKISLSLVFWRKFLLKTIFSHKNFNIFHLQWPATCICQPHSARILSKRFCLALRRFCGAQYLFVVFPRDCWVLNIAKFYRFPMRLTSLWGICLCHMWQIYLLNTYKANYCPLEPI